MPLADRYLLIGDETALPAIANWLEMLPDDAAVTAHILIEAPEAQIDLRAPKAAQIHWHAYDAQDAQAMTRLIAAIPDPDTALNPGEAVAFAKDACLPDGRRFVSDGSASPDVFTPPVPSMLAEIAPGHRVRLASTV